MSAPHVFDSQYYEHLNRARGEVVSQLLSELKPRFDLQTAVDVGCGLGYFSQFLKSLGLEVTAVDGRRENLDEAQRRNPEIRFLCFNAEDPAIKSLGKFDLVFCFGILYHLENPMLAIRHLYEMTGKLLLVEAVVQPGDEPAMALIEEAPQEDQGLNHIAFYPTESCLLKMFYRGGFANAYTFSMQPKHPEYSAYSRKPRIRTMLAASHALVHSNLLVSAPEPKSPVHPWSLAQTRPKYSAAEKFRRFAKKPLPEKGQGHPENHQAKVSPLEPIMAEKPLVPIYLPRWMSRSLLKLKHALIPSHEAIKKIKMTADFAPKYKPEEHWLVKSGIKTILDVGAHKGEFAQRIRAILPDADLVCFEPLREPFLALSRRFAGQPNFLALQCALGDEAAQCEIHRNEYTPSSSLLPMTALHKRSFTFAVEEETEVIEVRRLSDVVRELNLRDPLLLKLDVQGFEDKVITGGEDVVARAHIIIIEVSFLPLFEGGPLFDHIYQILKTRGFTYNGQFDQLLSPADGRPLQADAIFCRA